MSGPQKGSHWEGSRVLSPGWLKGELERRGLRMADMARAMSDTSFSSISRVNRGVTHSLRTWVAVMEFLDATPVVDVEKLAG